MKSFRIIIAAPFLILALLYFVGCASYGNAPAAPTETLATGRKIYVAKCAKCHKLYAPAQYSNAAWEKWMRKMSKKANLSADQETLLSGYVEEVIRAPAKTQTAPD